MTRLGLWGQGSPFPAFHVFEHAISKGGPGAMELVALDMKQRGMCVMPPPPPPAARALLSAARA